MISAALLMALGASAQSSESIKENMILSAVEKYNERDHASAREILNNIVKQDQDNDAAWYYLAMISTDEGDLETAEACMRRAVELDPDNFWYRYRLAAIYSITSRSELTVDIYEKLLQDFPQKSDLYFDLAELYAAQRDYDKALKTLEEIETVFGVTESIAVYRFNLLRQTGKMEEAYKSLEKYNEKYSSPYVLSTLADYQMSMYNDSTALAYYDEALELAPDFSPAILGKAETLRMTRRYSEYFDALGSFILSSDAAVEGKCDYMMAVVQRSDPKFLRSFMPQIDTAMMNLVSVHPSDSLALRTAAVYYYTVSQDQRAKELFSRTAELYPESLTASANYIEFLMYAQMWEDLSREGRKAFMRFPEEPGFMEMAGVGDYNLNDLDKVLETCEVILETAPSDSSKTLRAWSTMGDIYHELGDSKKAYKAYDKALKINPGYVYVLNNYAYFLCLEGKKLKKAHDMSRKTVEADPDNAIYLDTYAWILYLMGKPAEAKPLFKKAMLTGGKDSAVILDHYADVLYALKEYDMAFIYWNLARQKNAGDIPDLDEKIRNRREESGR